MDGGWTERALMAGAFEGESFDAEPVRHAQIVVVLQTPQGSNGALGLLIDRTPPPISRSKERHNLSRDSGRVIKHLIVPRSPWVREVNNDRAKVRHPAVGFVPPLERGARKLARNLNSLRDFPLPIRGRR